MANRVLVFALLLALLAACKNHDNHMDGGPHSWSAHLKTNIGIDMSKVQGFTLAPVKQTSAAPPAFRAMNGDCIAVGQGSAGAGSAECVSLFALSATGLVPAVILELPQQQNKGDGCCNNGGMSTVPQTIFNLNKFVLFVYQQQMPTDAGMCGMIILQKSNGNLYCSKDSVASCYNNGGSSDCFGRPFDQLVQSSENAEIVYGFRMDGALLRFDFANPASATATVLIDQTDGNAGHLDVNDVGDALISFSPKNAQLTDLRFYRRTTGFVPLQPFSMSMGGQALCTYRGPGTDATNFFVVVPPYNPYNSNNPPSSAGMTPR